MLIHIGITKKNAGAFSLPTQILAAKWVDLLHGVISGKKYTKNNVHSNNVFPKKKE